MADIPLIDVPNLNWPFSVLSSTDTPPGGPSVGDCYLVGTSPTGAWSGHANAIARWNDSSAWEFQAPSEGRTVWNVATDLWVTWNGSAWANANPLPTGGATGQVLAKTSNSDYAVGWSTVSGSSGPTTIYFFSNVESISNLTGSIGDIALVGGSPNGLYYKNGSNVWAFGGSISSGASITYGTPSALTVGGSNTDGVATSVARSDHKHSLPAFGTASGTFCEGNDSRLTNTRAPSGSAGGDLGGTYPNPTVAALRETSGPTQLTIGSVSDGQFLRRSGTGVVGSAPTVTVKKAGTTIGTRGSVNFVEGSNVTITASDNSGADRVDVTIAASGGGGGGSTWSYAGLRNRYAISSSLGSAGTQVTTLTDSGSAAKNFTQSTGSLAPTVGVDSNGLYYISGNGTSQFMDTASAADWTFTCGETPFTVAMVIGAGSVPSVTAAKFLASTSWQGDTTGFAVAYSVASSTDQGPVVLIGGGAKQNARYMRPLSFPTPSVVVIRHHGARGANSSPTGGLCTPYDTELWIDGRLIAISTQTSTATNASFYPTSTRTMTLLSRKSSGGVAQDFADTRFYDLWFHDTALSDRKLNQYFEYCASTWGCAS